jgi:hypothetical protein
VKFDASPFKASGLGGRGVGGWVPPGLAYKSHLVPTRGWGVGVDESSICVR